MIANYDKYDYDYSDYWDNRDYEHQAEVRVLQKFLKGSKGNFFVDIGGSFGRHAPLYSKRFKKPIIVDYSLKTLQKNKDAIQKRFPNIELIAANAYKLPFADSSIDGAMMVRVLHHINLPDTYFKEVSRILSNKAEYLQEFANKYHIKARISHFIKGDFKFFSTKPYQQPTAENYEGTEGEEAIFLNFHPSYIKKLLSKQGFKVLEKAGSSFFRIPLLKKILPDKALMNMEKVAQSLLSQTNIAPSVYFKSTLSKDGLDNKSGDLDKILRCPQCGGELDFSTEKQEANCKQCQLRFEKKKGIWDFRVD